MSQDFSMPAVADVRSRIEYVNRSDVRAALQYTYLIAGRSCETVGRGSNGEPAYGPRGEDARLETFRWKGPGEVWFDEEVVVFTVKTAKRGGRPRSVAVPTKYEPWARPVYEYFRKWGPNPVFNFTRQLLGSRTRESLVFNGLRYPVESYLVKTGEVDDKGEPVKRKVLRHPKNFALHALRHLRASELVEVYGFDGPQLCAYGGWTYRHAGLPGVLDRYVQVGWQGYLPKLLRGPA